MVITFNAVPVRGATLSWSGERCTGGNSLVYLHRLESVPSGI